MHLAAVGRQTTVMERLSLRVTNPIQSFGPWLRAASWTVLASAAMATAGCVTAAPVAFDPTAEFLGIAWVPISPATSNPPYPAAAKAAHLAGEITFAVLLDDSGAVDRRTLTVIGLSDGRLLGVACPWVEHARFRSATPEPRAAADTGRTVTAIAILYSPDWNAGRLVQPNERDWNTVVSMHAASSLDRYRRRNPQCP